VFSAPSAPESDVVLRTSPAIRGGYRSPQLLFTGAYTFDAEQYRDHPELNDRLARQQADLNLRYDAGRTATFTTIASYLTTQLPEEFNTVTALVAQRAPATQYSVAPALSWALGTVTRASVQFEFARSAFTDAAAAGSAFSIAPSIVTRTLTFGLDRRVSATNTVRGRYLEEEFEFGGAPPLAISAGTSRAALLGWTHDLSSLTRATVMAGPRFSDGAVRPEISAELRRHVESGDLAIAFERTESVALGETGTIEVERLAATATVRPARRLELRAGPSISHDSASGLDATVYLVDVAATRALTRWFSIEASYQSAWERGDAPQFGPLAFARRVFTIRAITTAPSRPGIDAGGTRTDK
jgi:hypothetical protein